MCVVFFRNKSSYVKVWIFMAVIIDITFTWLCYSSFFVKTYGHAMRIKTVWLATVRPQNGSSGFHGKVDEVWILRHWFLLAFWARSCKQHTCSLSHSCQLKPEVIGTSRPLCFIMRPTAWRKQALVQNRFDLTSLAASLTKANAFRVLRTRREGWFTMVPVRERYWPPSGFTNPSKMASANRWIMLWRSILRAHAAEDRFGELKWWWFWIKWWWFRPKKQNTDAFFEWSPTLFSFFPTCALHSQI